MNVAEISTTTEAIERPRVNALLAALVYGVLMVGCAFVAYWAMFETFPTYDDAGYFSHQVALFIHGHVLYNQVYSEFGPFSYELWRGVFALSGVPFTFDSARVAIVVVWLLTSLMLGLTGQRLSGRLSLGVITLVLGFAVLVGFNKEPMHPNGVATLLLATAVAAVAFIVPRRPAAGLCALGALLSALVLTKVNVGVFASLATCYAAVMALPALRQVRALRWLAAAAIVGIGPVIMLGKLSQQGWVQDYAMLGAASALAIALNSYSPQGESRTAEHAPEHTHTWLAWLFAGVMVCAVAIVATMLALGTSLHAFVQDVVVVPLVKGAGYTAPVQFTQLGALWAIVCGGAAYYFSRCVRSGRVDLRRPGLYTALGRGVAGLALWMFCLRSLHLGRLTNPIIFALPLAWVAALPSMRDDGSARGQFIRLFIPTLAVLEGLMAYPVAGTHIEFGSFLLVLCGTMCVADAWAELNAWAAAEQPPIKAAILHSYLNTGAVAGAIVLVLAYIAYPARWEHRVYVHRHVGLTIAGATDLRLAPERAEEFEKITALLRARCSAVMSFPPMLSFNIWSRLPEPSDIIAEPFWNLLTRGQEREYVARAQATRRLCLVSNPLVVEKWAEGYKPPQVPLVAYMEHAFKPVAEYGEYTVSVRPSALAQRTTGPGAA